MKKDVIDLLFQVFGHGNKSYSTMAQTLLPWHTKGEKGTVFIDDGKLNFSSLSTSLFDINNPLNCPQTDGDSQTESNSNLEQRQMNNNSILSALTKLTIAIGLHHVLWSFGLISWRISLKNLNLLKYLMTCS